ncbi:MAG: hypothetical protein EA416_14125, partial [Trueperaceae bacterium]
MPRPRSVTSLDDPTTLPPTAEPGPTSRLDDAFDDAIAVDDPATITGRGVTRGLLLHALLEELIHGLLPADEAALQARAATLLPRLAPT